MPRRPSRSPCRGSPPRRSRVRRGARRRGRGRARRRLPPRHPADDPVAEAPAAEEQTADEAPGGVMAERAVPARRARGRAAPPSDAAPAAEAQPAEHGRGRSRRQPRGGAGRAHGDRRGGRAAERLVRLGESRQRLPRAARALARRRLCRPRDRRRPVGPLLDRPRRVLRAPQRAPRGALAPVRRGRHEEEGADRRVRGPARAGRPAQDRRRARPD